MRNRRLRHGLVLASGVLVLSLLGGVSLRAQDGADHLDRLAGVAANLQKQLPAGMQRALSSGGQQLLALGGRAKAIRGALGSVSTGAPLGPGSVPGGFANDPNTAEDFTSRLAGMTQSETSAAWCGSNAVIGFNDSGSFMDTAFFGTSPSQSFSFQGWSRSTDQGASFTDQGAVLPDPLPSKVLFRDLFGDPVLGCTDPSTFYYTSLAVDTLRDARQFTAIAVSRSTDDGASWGRTRVAVAKSAFRHFLDKPWMAVQPGPTASPNDDVVHVTYTDFDFSFNSPACGDDIRTAIEYVRSTNGGGTWSQPVALDEICGFEPFVQGSQVEGGLGGDVFVAWEHFDPDFVTREIRLARSTDGGASFGSPTVVTGVTPLGDGFFLQGLFRDFLDLQGLAVDRSAGPRRGSLYITYQDGGALAQQDPFGGCKPVTTRLYCFGDVLFRRSTDGGTSWSKAVRVNDDLGVAADQFMPALEVDASGALWTLFYDRRRDPRNFLIDAYVGRSDDGGTSWSNTRVSHSQFPPLTAWQDLLVNPSYMGDYISIATDATGGGAGAVASWGDNILGDANVLFAKVPS